MVETLVEVGLAQGLPLGGLFALLSAQFVDGLLEALLPILNHRHRHLRHRLFDLLAPNLLRTQRDVLRVPLENKVEVLLSQVLRAVLRAWLLGRRVVPVVGVGHLVVELAYQVVKFEDLEVQLVNLVLIFKQVVLVHVLSVNAHDVFVGLHLSELAHEHVERVFSINIDL